MSAMAMAGDGSDDKKMEGWLHLVRSNRLGMQSSRKRYFVLQGSALHCYKTAPASEAEEPARTAIIDSSKRVKDNGRMSINRNVIYIFTIYSTTNHSDQLKLGAISSEEAAKWIKSLTEAAFMEVPNHPVNLSASSTKRLRSTRSRSEKKRMHSIDWTVFSSVNGDPIVTSDVVAPCMWTIVGCRNGLRLFKEAKDADFPTKDWEDHPAMMAVGCVDASSEAIFQTVMSLGQSRSEWDFCLLEGNVVEQVDGHTDIIHKKLRSDWLPWGLKRRDLLLRRYWRREDDGSYVILYHSIVHPKCQPEKGHVRAWLKSGGYEISPTNQAKQSVVKHMLAIDWKLWKARFIPSSSMFTTLKMLGRVAALREYFLAKHGDFDCSQNDCLIKEILSSQNESEQKDRLSTAENSGIHDFVEDSDGDPLKPTGSGSLQQLHEAADEFFDVPAETVYDHTDASWSSNETIMTQSEEEQNPNTLQAASAFMKKLHDIAVQKMDYTETEGDNATEPTPCHYGSTLVKDTNCSTACSWAMADPSSFLIRGESYIHDHQKVKATSTLMQLVGADWLKSDKREDNLCAREGGIVQEYAAKGGNEFFFVVHIQVPGVTTYSLALYYMMEGPLESVPVLESFVKGDDAYRNSRFKLIPYISKGSWIVKQSVGKKACIVGQALEINYHHGSNYIELGVDVGSSTVARGVVNLVIGYLNSLVIELAFLIQGNSQDELPETVLGTCRMNHLDVAKAASINNS